MSAPPSAASRKSRRSSGSPCGSPGFALRSSSSWGSTCRSVGLAGGTRNERLEIGLLIPWPHCVREPAGGRLADRLGRCRPFHRPVAAVRSRLCGDVGLQGSGQSRRPKAWRAGPGAAVAADRQPTLFAQARGLADYGRVAGPVRLHRRLADQPAAVDLLEATILWVIVGGVMVLVSLAVPEIRLAAVRPGPDLAASATGFLVFLGVAVVLMASMRSSRGVTYWRRVGVDPTVIGLLWAEGVVAEILFAYGRRAWPGSHGRSAVACGGGPGPLAPRAATRSAGQRSRRCTA